MQFLPVRELPAVSRDNADWIWDGFLARQAVTLLSSQPKAGKSTLIFGLMQKLLAGEPFLSRGTKSCGVVYLSEEPFAALREKGERFDLPVHGDRIQFVSRRQKPNQNLDLIKALDGALQKSAAIGAGLIVIDTLSAWAGLRSEEENSSAACETLMARFKEAAGASNTALLLIHHTRKDGTTARGSTVLTGSADILVMLEREDIFQASGTAANVARLKVASRFSDAPDPIDFELTDEGYARVGPQIDAIRKHAEVFKLLPETLPGMTREELSAACGLTRWQVRSALNELIAQDAVTVVGRGTSADPNRFLRKQCA